MKTRGIFCAISLVLVGSLSVLPLDRVMANRGNVVRVSSVVVHHLSSEQILRNEMHWAEVAEFYLAQRLAALENDVVAKQSVIDDKNTQILGLQQKLDSVTTGYGGGGAVSNSAGGGGSGNHFPWGFCTWYAASQYRTFIPWFGNAISWIGGARLYGFPTGSSPRVGAIMVTAESGFGHVAYVDSVSGSGWTVLEMNYRGWGIVDRRYIAYGGVPLLGFIY